MSEVKRTPYELAQSLHHELSQLSEKAKAKTLPLDMDMLEAQFGVMAEEANELCETLKAEEAAENGAPKRKRSAKKETNEINGA